MAADLHAELSLLRAERQVLHTALGQQIADRPWPRAGDTILIGSSWDGRAIHGQDSFLSLAAGSRVRISHVSSEGWLWGTIEGTCQSGWLGGRGCTAEQQVTISVPLGPSHHSPAPPGLPPPDVQYAGQIMESELQDFFDQWGIDESAQQALKELPMLEQRRVVETELMNCRNPSAVLLSRIRALQRSRAVGMASGLPPAGLAPLAARPRSRSPRRQAEAMEVEEYVLRHGIDEAASQALRALPPERQLEVMASDLNNCRNPSAVLMGRIRALEIGSRQNQLQIASLTSGLAGMPMQVPSHQPGAASALFAQQAGVAGGHSQMRAEEFIRRHGLDEAAAQALRDLPPQGQVAIIEAELINVRNPSAVVQSRIQAYRHGGPSGAAFTSAPSSADLMGGGGVQPGVVEEYIRRFNLDEKVAHELRTLDAEAQRHVLDSEVVNARNPSAVVTSRIQEVKNRSSMSFANFGLSPRR